MGLYAVVVAEISATIITHISMNAPKETHYIQSSMVGLMNVIMPLTISNRY